MAAAPKPETPAAPARVMVTVLRGRTVARHVQVGTKLLDGKTVPILALQTICPGESFEVDADEAQHLRATGFVIDPDGQPPLVEPQRTALLDATENPTGIGLQRNSTPTW
jgi:hypothetical protein